MKKPVLLLFAVVIPFASINVESSMEAQSAQKLKKITGPGANAIEDLGKKPSIFVPLSEAECTGLGGKVLSTVEGCSATGKVCYTTDTNGVIHSACITAN